jgi:hypothetical protein
MTGSSDHDDHDMGDLGTVHEVRALKAAVVRVMRHLSAAMLGVKRTIPKGSELRRKEFEALQTLTELWRVQAFQVIDSLGEFEHEILFTSATSQVEQQPVQLSGHLLGGRDNRKQAAEKLHETIRALNRNLAEEIRKRAKDNDA